MTALRAVAARDQAVRGQTLVRAAVPLVAMGRVTMGQGTVARALAAALALAEALAEVLAQVVARALAAAQAQVVGLALVAGLTIAQEARAMTAILSGSSEKVKEMVGPIPYAR